MNKQNIIEKSRDIKGFEIPEIIMTIDEVDITGKEVLTSIYYKNELPPDIFKQQVYSQLIQSQNELMNRLCISKEKLKATIAKLVELNLIDDSKYHGMLKSLHINSEELQRRYKANTQLPIQSPEIFKQRNLFQRIALAVRVSCRILRKK